MVRTRFYSVALLAALCVCWLASPVFAWEFEMSGKFVWEHEAIGQTGDNGFFGKHDVDLSTGTVDRWGHVNAFLGWGEAGIGRTVSGHDAAADTQYMDVIMKLKINKAVDIEGRYHIGAWAGSQVNTPPGVTPLVLTQASEYYANEWSGVQQAFSPGYWNWLRLRAKTPWGDLTIGKRPSRFGMGMWKSGDEDTSTETVALGVPFGPITIGWSWQWARIGDATVITDAGATTPTTGGAQSGYYNRTDTSGMRQVVNSFGVNYTAGGLQVGYEADYNNNRYRGPERDFVTDTTARNGRSREEIVHKLFGKYNNGRFFLNSELDWVDARIAQLRFGTRAGGAPAAWSLAMQGGATTPANVNNHQTYYEEHYRYAIETGFFAGPAKLSLLFSRVQGPERRGQGVLTGFANMAYNRYDKDHGGGFGNSSPFLFRYASGAGTGAVNTVVFEPYSYMMVYNYGLGTNISGSTGNGYVVGAWVAAARLDYAVASNLNVYGTFVYAKRPDNGYGWGYIAPYTAVTAGSERNLVANATAFLDSPTAPTANAVPGAISTGAWKGSPAIPADELGWEIDLGFDWKLLEGYNAALKFAWWQPGEWFQYACLSKNNPAWRYPDRNGVAVVSPTGSILYYGAEPSRVIDPVWGLNFQLSGEF